jgi:hypothetical protein
MPGVQQTGKLNTNQQWNAIRTVIRPKLRHKLVVPHERLPPAHNLLLRLLLL